MAAALCLMFATAAAAVPIKLYWSVQPVPGGVLLTDVAASPTALVAVGASGIILRSTDGRNWTQVESSSPLFFSFVIWRDGVFLTGGSSDGVRFSTDDGLSWQVADGPNTNGISRAERLGDLWVGLRTSGLGGLGVVISQDLATWELAPSHLQFGSGIIYDAASDGTRLLKAASPMPPLMGPTFVTWTDGQQPWTLVTTFDEAVTNLSHNGERFIASGGNWGTPKIQTSADGLDWETVDLAPMPYGRLHPFSPGPNGYLAGGLLAGGQLDLLSSRDLSSWQLETSVDGQIRALVPWRSGWVGVGQSIVLGQPGPAPVPVLSRFGTGLLVLALLGLALLRMGSSRSRART